MNTRILYHANCTDGQGAALAAWLVFGDAGATYTPVRYGDAPPADLDGADVFILDFSYPRDTLTDIARRAHKLVILDHHKTAAEDLDGFADDAHPCPVTVVFDMNKSGAALAWEFFHGPNLIGHILDMENANGVLAWERFRDPCTPQLIAHIQDRDLWKFELPGTNDIIRGLQLHPDWRTWSDYILRPDLIQELEREGHAINKYLQIQAEKIVQHPPIRWILGPEPVPVYNVPKFLTSDVLHLALERWPDAPYAVGWTDDGDRRIYSLRSRQGSDVDVSALAKRHGGGGHKHAAGFTSPVIAFDAPKEACA